MKWKIYPLMGAIRIECEDCLHYATEFSEADGVKTLINQKINCPYCLTCTLEANKRKTNE